MNILYLQEASIESTEAVNGSDNIPISIDLNEDEDEVTCEDKIESDRSSQQESQNSAEEYVSCAEEELQSNSDETKSASNFKISVDNVNFIDPDYDDTDEETKTASYSFHSISDAKIITDSEYINFPGALQNIPFACARYYKKLMGAIGDTTTDSTFLAQIRKGQMEFPPDDLVATLCGTVLRGHDPRPSVIRFYPFFIWIPSEVVPHIRYL